MFNPQGVGTHDHIIGPRLTDQQIIELVDAYPELEERFKTLMESPNFNISYMDLVVTDEITIDHPDFIHTIIDIIETHERLEITA